MSSHSRRIFFLLNIFFFVSIFAVSSSQACRFWAAAAPHVQKEMVIRQLLEEPQSLKSLSGSCPDGWSVSYYEKSSPIIFRGSRSSYDDQRYDLAVNDVAEMNPGVVVAHLQQASSGCGQGAVDPYPLVRLDRGNEWLFIHTGDIDKGKLISLIGEGYLQKNPPSLCTGSPPDSWIDSELYFILILKEIDSHKGDVEAGLKYALAKLRETGEEGRLSFVLTDGHSLWSFRQDNGFFYTYDKEQGLSVVASTVPLPGEMQWNDFPENTLAVMYPGQEPRFIPVK